MNGATAPAEQSRSRPIEHYELDWRGLKVRVVFQPDAFGGVEESYHYSHLQIENARRRQPLPMSETGYRSHHLPAGEIEASGGPVAYVTRWLETAARTREWKAIEAGHHQGCLF